jgi:hypothetical protein
MSKVNEVFLFRIMVVVIGHPYRVTPTEVQTGLLWESCVACDFRSVFIKCRDGGFSPVRSGIGHPKAGGA